MLATVIFSIGIVIFFASKGIAREIVTRTYGRPIWHDAERSRNLALNADGAVMIIGIGLCFVGIWLGQR